MKNNNSTTTDSGNDAKRVLVAGQKCRHVDGEIVTIVAKVENGYMVDGLVNYDVNPAEPYGRTLLCSTKLLTPCH